MAFGGNALVQLVALGLPATGSAQAPTPVRIEFDAPADCSTGEAFYQGVRSRTDRVRRAEPGEPGTELRVRLTKEPGKVHGELDLTSEHGESDRRVVDGESCEEVVEALSLTAALAIDPEARVSPEPPQEATPPPVAAPPAPRPPPPPAPSFRSSFELALHARGAVAEVVSPFVSIGGELSATVSPVSSLPNGPSFGITVVHLANDLFRDAAIGSVHLTAISADACLLTLEVGPGITLAPCASLAGGWLRARGQDLDRPSTVVRPFWSLGGEFLAGASLGAGFVAELGVGLHVPLVKRRFVVQRPPEPVAETPSVSPGGVLGIGYHFQ